MTQSKISALFLFLTNFQMLRKIEKFSLRKIFREMKRIVYKILGKFFINILRIYINHTYKKIPFCVDNHQFFAIIWLWIDFEKYVKKFIFYIIKIKDCLRIDASKFWNVNKTIRLRAKIQTAKKESHLSFPWTRSKNRITVE